MRFLFTTCFIFFSAICFGQLPNVGDKLKHGAYDTLNIEIQSLVSFQFCSETYTLPRDCDGNYPPNCCTYSTSLYKGENLARHGFVSCYNGSSLSWSYFQTPDIAKQNAENFLPQLENQMKKFKQTPIKLFVMNKESNGFVVETETLQGFVNYYIITHGTHNGFNFSLQYSSAKKINTTEDLQPVIRQIIRL
jgi:hypothetical protein